MTLTFQNTSGKVLETLPIGFEPSDDIGGSNSFRVRDLIEKLVRESVRDFHLRERDRTISFLTPEKIEKGVAVGKFGSPREEAQTVDIDNAIGQALQAFEDQLYLLFVDKAEKKALEEVVFLAPETNITVIRLVALSISTV